MIILVGIVSLVLLVVVIFLMRRSPVEKFNNCFEVKHVYDINQKIVTILNHKTLFMILARKQSPPISIGSITNIACYPKSSETILRMVMDAAGYPSIDSLHVHYLNDLPHTLENQPYDSIALLVPENGSIINQWIYNQEYLNIVDYYNQSRNKHFKYMFPYSKIQPFHIKRKVRDPSVDNSVRTTSLLIIDLALIDKGKCENENENENVQKYRKLYGDEKMDRFFSQVYDFHEGFTQPPDMVVDVPIAEEYKFSRSREGLNQIEIPGGKIGGIPIYDNERVLIASQVDDKMNGYYYSMKNGKDGYVLSNAIIYESMDIINDTPPDHINDKFGERVEIDMRASAYADLVPKPLDGDVIWISSMKTKGVIIGTTLHIPIVDHNSDTKNYICYGDDFHPTQDKFEEHCDGMWDAPCEYNDECPFYDDVSGRGMCKSSGYCEMPLNVRQDSFTKYTQSTNSYKSNLGFEKLF